MTSGRSRLLLWALALLCAAGFARLGAWQLGRMHEKQAMLDASHAVLAARTPHPLAFAADPQRAGAYDWAVGSGRFLDAPAILLDNQARDGRIGVRVYRAFAPVDTAAPAMLVDLGWLPLDGERHLPAIARPAGTRHVAGLLAAPPSAGLARSVLVPQPSGSLLTIALTIPDAQRALHLPALAPRVLRLDPVLPIGYARDLAILPNTLPPARHLGYAVQWFAMAATVLVIALVLTFRTARAHIRP